MIGQYSTQRAVGSAAVASRPRPLPSGVTTDPESLLSSLHIGMGWHEEQAGGLNRMVSNLLLHLPAANVSARALVAGSPQVEQQSHGRAVAFAALTDPLPVRVLRARRAGRRAVEALRPDLVALHFALFGQIESRVWRETPLVIHFHGPWASEGLVEGGGPVAAAAKRWVERRVYRHASRFIALSDAFASVLERQYGVDRRMVRVVPGGVDVNRFQPSGSRREARALLDLPLDRPTVAVVRRLTSRMGLQNLVAAFDQVRRKVPDALLLIAGVGPLHAALAAQIVELGLSQHARLLGRIGDDELPLLYRAADLSIVPSTALEGFGLITVESLAAGTPALVTPVGGLPEVVRDLSGDLVLSDSSPGSLADGIVAALLGTLALPSSQACIDFARRRYAWPTIAQRVAAVYREVA